MTKVEVKKAKNSLKKGFGAMGVQLGSEKTSEESISQSNLNDIRGAEKNNLGASKSRMDVTGQETGKFAEASKFIETGARSKCQREENRSSRHTSKVCS